MMMMIRMVWCGDGVRGRISKRKWFELKYLVEHE